MGKTLNKDLKKFLKTIESNLICCKEEKKKIITSLENDINSKIEDSVISSISDITNMFGTPESIVSSYQINNDEAVKLHKHRKKLMRIVLIVLVALIVSVALYFVVESLDTLDEINGYYTVTITEDTPAP